MLADLSVDRFLAEKPLAITVAGLEELRGHIMGRLAAFDSSPRNFLASVAADMQAATEAQRKPRAGSVGVIQVRGTISQHSQGDISSLLFGGTTTEAVSTALRGFLADDSIGRIVLDIDSPGGSTYGVAELAAEIQRARGQKPIVAVANSLAASAAYWIGAAADQFYVTPGGLVGSIGVYAMHMDISQAAEKEGVKPTFISAGKYKLEGNQFEPLSAEAQAHVQSIVNETYGQFVAAVARGRGVSDATVRNGYGQGRVVTAKQAKALGMVDGIYTLEQAITRDIQSVSQPLTEQAAETAPADIHAGEDEAGRKRLALIRWHALEERVAV